MIPKKFQSTNVAFVEISIHFDCHGIIEYQIFCLKNPIGTSILWQKRSKLIVTKLLLINSLSNALKVYEWYSSRFVGLIWSFWTCFELILNGNEVVRKFFGRSFKGTFPENYSKWQQWFSKTKKALILAIFAILSRFPGRFPWKLVRKISERLPFHQLSLKHIQNYHLSQTNRLGYPTVNLKQFCHNQFWPFFNHKIDVPMR